MTAPSPHDDLAAIIMRSLLPQRFPFRRDVDLHGAATQANGHVCFHDNHWLAGTVLAVSAVRIDAGGIDGALAATAFRQLLRAALARDPDPRAALSACLELSPRPDLAAAVVTLDTGDGAIASAATGQARVEVLPDGGNGPLSPGNIVWIAAGDIATPHAAGVPVEGLGALVEPALARGGSGSVAALHFARASRAAESATFTVPNDPAAIPAFLKEMQRFLASRAIGEEEAAGVEVALDELLTNTISYAFRDGQAHEILVSPALEGEQLLIEIRDDGAPFDPLRVPEPDLSGGIEERRIGGLGMHFVRTVMDEVRYRREDGWNVLALRKRLGGQGPADEVRL